MERLVAQYKVYSATVTIKDVGGVGLYLVQEPYLDQGLRHIVDRLAKSLIKSGSPITYDRVLQVVSEAKTEGDPEVISYYVFKTVNYGDLTVPLYDERVERIEFHGIGIPVSVVHSSFKNYPRLTTNLIFVDKRNVEMLLQRFNVSDDRAFSETCTKEGHKVIAYRPFGGLYFEIIKRFTSVPPLINVCKDLKCSLDALAYLWDEIERGGIHVIGGDTSATKALVNSLLLLSRRDLKVTTIESEPRLNFEGRNWLRVDPWTRKGVLLAYLSAARPDVVLADLHFKVVKVLLECGCRNVILFTETSRLADVMDSIVGYLGKKYKPLLLSRLSSVVVYDSGLRIYSVDKLRRKVLVRRVNPSLKLSLARSRPGGSSVLNLHKRREFLEKVVEENVSDNAQIQEMLRQYLEMGSF